MNAIAEATRETGQTLSALLRLPAMGRGWRAIRSTGTLLKAAAGSDRRAQRLAAAAIPEAMNDSNLFGAVAFEPDFVEREWRERFVRESYCYPGMTFEDYAPAYMVGIAARRQYAGRSYDEVREALVEHYACDRGTSRLSWMQAEPAVKAAWAAYADQQTR